MHDRGKGEESGDGEEDNDPFWEAANNKIQNVVFFSEQVWSRRKIMIYQRKYMRLHHYNIVI